MRVYFTLFVVVCLHLGMPLSSSPACYCSRLFYGSSYLFSQTASSFFRFRYWREGRGCRATDGGAVERTTHTNTPTYAHSRTCTRGQVSLTSSQTQLVVDEIAIVPNATVEWKWLSAASSVRLLCRLLYLAAQHALLCLAESCCACGTIQVSMMSLCFSIRREEIQL